MNNQIVNNVLFNYLDDNQEFIFIPPQYKRLKIDLGTSGDGPNTEMWIKDAKVCVIGFEPNPINLTNMKYKFHEYISKQQVILIQTALSNSTPYIADFYCVKNNEGCSSLHLPIFDRIPEYKELSNIIHTPVIRLLDFFELFPWHQIPFIDHLKIDAQGSDYDIVLGAGTYLKEAVAYLSVEAGTGEDYDYDSKPLEMLEYIMNQGFVEYKMNEFNWSFFNPKFNSFQNEINPIVTG